MPDLSQQAILTALSQDWEQAISLNETMIAENGQDLDALSRLAYAYSQTGNIESAKKLYKKILNLDKYNYIARKNLDRISSLSKTTKQHVNNQKHSVSPSLFIEEPGKTKTVALTNVAPVSVLAHVGIGQTVILTPRKHGLEVRSSNKTYLGAFPDDIAFRLLRLLKAGNTYHVCVKNVGKNTIAVFIRELKRGSRVRNVPSFQNSLEASPIHSRGKKLTTSGKKLPSQPDDAEELDV